MGESKQKHNQKQNSQTTVEHIHEMFRQLSLTVLSIQILEDPA